MRIHEKQLDKELSNYLDLATHADTGESYPVEKTRAIIAPHAGYRYSGPTAAHAYRCVGNVADIKRVFILGPSHHAYLRGCALSSCQTFESPLGNLVADEEVTKALYETGEFEYMSARVDEAEHSLEMHFPFTAKIFEGQPVKIVTIMVGSLSVAAEAKYGSILAPYLASPDSLFIISSDFCHWGERFRYTYYQADGSRPVELSERDKVTTPIHESIRVLDRQGMDLIESMDHDAFSQYLKQTENTICGRHPIGVLLAALKTLDRKRIRFVKYAQSNACQSVYDSSVSYASAYVTMENE